MKRMLQDINCDNHQIQLKIPRPLTFLDSVRHWEYVAFDADCFPPLHELPLRPKSTTHDGNVLLLDGGCASGKSTRVREFVHVIDRLLEEEPRARVLFVAANQLYAKNLSSELAPQFKDVVCYLDAARDTKISAQFVVCTLESVHRLSSAPFHLIVLDEVRSIAGLLGGETLPLTQWPLQNVLRSATYMIACDAHVRVDDCVRDFLRLATPRRQVVHVRLTRSRLQRSVHLLYQREGGKEVWFSEIQSACEQWHANPERRFAVSVGSKARLSDVCKVLQQQGVPFCSYSSNTNARLKFAQLEDPDTAWKEIGAVVSMSTLSVGVDPKHVQFDRVFMWTCRKGCLLRSMVQGVMRFGRSRANPLRNESILGLMDCDSPRVHQVRVNAGKVIEREPLSLKTALERLYGSRASTTHQLACEERLVGLKSATTLSDSMLQVLAHNMIEQEVQGTHLRAMAQHVFECTTWSVREEHELGLTEHIAWSSLELSEEQELQSIKTESERWKWGYEHIVQRGDFEFLHEHCYGLALESRRGDQFSAVELLLRKMFFSLQHLQTLPESVEDCLEVHKLRDALQMRALRLCLRAESVIRDDAASRSDHHGRSTAHPQQRMSRGLRMQALDDAACFLGGREVFLHGGELPQSAVEFVNCDDVDDTRKCQLRQLALNSSTTRVTATSPKALIRSIAHSAGFRLVTTESRPHSSESRPRAVVSMRLEPMMPHIVQDWSVWSPVLHRAVAVRDWQAVHAGVDWDRIEEQLRTLLPDADFDPVQGDQRTELLDAAGLRHLLETSRDAKQRKWLERADSASLPELNGTRELRVIYGKKRVIGRHQASRPSLQGCPSLLRAALVGKRCHDIDIVNCHPTLMLQVCRKVNLDTPQLEMYVEDRDSILCSIRAHYDCSRNQAKTAVLRVLNGGPIEQWRKDEAISAQRDEPHLLDMVDETHRIREAFFALPQFERPLVTLCHELNSDGAKSQRGLARSCFSYCIFELEDTILNIIDSSLREGNWKVRSLIYDGMLVDHRDDADLEDVLRCAERRVFVETLYK